MGENDWLERGHGGGEGLRPLIKGSADGAADRVSIRSVLRGTTPPRKPRVRTKALIGWLLYCATAVGGTAAAFTVRDTLFPALGAPTERGVWASANVDSTRTIEQASTSTIDTDTAFLEAAVLKAIVEDAPESSINAGTVPETTVADQGPNTSVDNGAPGPHREPGTVVIVDEGPSGGPGSTVDAQPTDTSTPPTVAEPTVPSTSTPDPTATTTSMPSSDASGHGGGGDGGSGGGHTTLP